MGQQTFNKISHILFPLIAFSIPMWMLINNIAIIATLCFAIFYVLKHGLNLNNVNRLHIVFFLLFLTMLYTLLYTSNVTYGIKKIEQRLPFLIIPILFIAFHKFINFQLIKTTTKAFVYSVLITSMICIYVAIKKTIYYASPNPFNEANGNFFSYFKLTEVIDDFHPIYYGTFVLFSIAVILLDFISKHKLLNLKKGASLLILSYLILFLFLINSFLLALVFAFTFMVMSYWIIKDTQHSPTFKLSFISINIVVILLASGFIINKFNGLNLKEDFTTKDFTGNEFTAVKARVAKMHGSIEVIKDNFLFGVGPGDAQDELNASYLNNKFYHGYQRSYNSHNQFLTEYIFSGLAGFLILVSLFYILFSRAIYFKNNPLLFITLLYFSFCLTESCLVRNKGIIFFTFFTCLFYTFPAQNERQ